MNFEFAEVFVWDTTITYSMDTGSVYFKNNHNNVKRIIDTKISQNKNRAREVVRMDREIDELQRVLLSSTEF